MTTSPSPDVYLAGTGALLMYSFGAAKYLKEHYDFQDAQILTLSGGALGAVALLSLPLSEFDLVAEKVARLYADLPFDRFANFRLPGKYRQMLELVVTAESLPLLRGHLQIATTKIPSFQRKTYIGPFLTTDEVIADLQTSAFIPFYFATLPQRGHCCEIDGGASKYPIDSSTTLKVSVRYDAIEISDIYLSKERQQNLRFRTYDEQLDLYRDGYRRAAELAPLYEHKIQRWKRRR